MYRPEVHRTVRGVKILEQLDFDLTITDQSYRSEHTASGKLQVHKKADDQVVTDREHPPRHPLGTLAAGLVGGDRLGASFPGTELYVGLARNPTLTQDKNAFQDDHSVEAVDVDGIPTNGTVHFDTDWDVGAARESISDDVTIIEDRNYEITGLPSDVLPIIVRANLYRDAKQLAAVLDRESTNDRRGQHQLEGLAAIVIELEHRDTAGGESGPLRIEGFRLNMSRVFPNIQFSPNQGSKYDPGAQRVEWGSNRISVDGSSTYAVIGPIEELLSVDRITGELRATLEGGTLSGMKVTNLFDESGSRFSSGPQQATAAETSHKVTITADIEIDPSALQGEAQKISTAEVSASTTPHELFDQVVKICDRNGIHIIDRTRPGDGEPVVGRDGVFHVDDDPGELDVRREYGNEGVVYAGMEVTGRYTAEAEETQVSAFDDADDRLVRRTEGGLSDRGRSTIKINARSASSELNSRFISTIEKGLEG